MANETIIDEKKENFDIYPLREPSVFPEAVVAPSDNRDIFAIKKEHVAQLGSLIGVTLSEGVFLCQAYRLDKLLSRDEMGEIWKASDLRESRNVIVHFPPLALRKDETAIEPLRQNARHLEALEHPRIVPLLASFTDPEHGFFTVRKFINGKPLDLYRTDYVKRHGKLASTKVVKMLNDIARCLDYAHSVDIVHGDLCLKNILVDLNDEVYADNFALSPIPVTTVSAERKPYLSPEMITGQPATALSDIYALAVIAYNLLSGRLPGIPELVDDNTPLPIPGVPSTADAVIQKAMAKEPDDRYDSCGAFLKALEASFQKSMTIKSVTITPSSTSLRKTTNSRVTFWAALIGLIGVIGIVAAMLYLPKIDEQPPPNGVVHEIAQQPAQEPQRIGNPVIPVQPPDPSPVDSDDSEKPSEVAGQIPGIEGIPEIPLVPPIHAHPQVALAGQNGRQTIPEPETLQDTDAYPPPTPAEPPSPNADMRIEASQPDLAVSLDESSERTLPVSLVDAIRQEGETMEITLGSTPYRFHWCKPFPMGGSGFWIQETPVTRESWLDVMTTMRRQPTSGTRMPVSAVSQNECNTFAKRMSDDRGILVGEEFDENHGYRFLLPTVAQWEYAHDLEILRFPNDHLEWCNDKNEMGDHAVCNSGVPHPDPNNWRTPREQGYENIGFRLVIVPVAE